MTLVAVALAVHIAAVVVAFGPLFAYPVLTCAVRRSNPAALPAVYQAQDVVARRVITPALPTALVAGVYLSLEGHELGKLWVVVPMIVLVVLMALHRIVLLDGYRRLAGGLAPESGHGLLDAERRVMVAQLVSVALVLFTIFVMAVKPVA